MPVKSTKRIRSLGGPTILLLSVLVILAGHAPLVSAQSSSASVFGRVTDQSSAVVPNTEVEIRNTGTGIVTTVKTNAEGLYVFPFLNPGNYLMNVHKPGFRTVSVTGITLNVQDNLSRNFVLQIGSVAESMTITADGLTMNTTDGTVSTTVDRQFVANLPLNGRSFQSLILLAPGVVVTPSGAENPGQFSVNGQRTNANYFTVDGVSANVGVSTSNSLGGSFTSAQQQAGSIPGLTALGGSNNLVSIDALEEFKIQSSTYSAEFGRQPGGQIALVTRSGANQFHGTAFDFLRNEAFDARNWFDKYYQRPKAALRQNQFGGTFGGPVLLPKLYNGRRNQTYFFFSYEGLKLLEPTSTAANTFVPSLRLRAAAAPSLQPILNAFPKPTGQETMVPSDPNNPSSPLIPSGLAPFNAGFSNPSTINATSIRIDQTIRNKVALFGRYNYSPSDSATRSLSILTGNSIATKTLTLGATFSMARQATSELRFNYSSNDATSFNKMDNFGGAVPVNLSQLIGGYSGSGKKEGSILFAVSGGYGVLSLGDSLSSSQRQFNIVDNVSWTKGAHLWKFGVDYRRLAPIFGPVGYSQYGYLLSESDIVNGALTYLSIFANQGSQPVFDNVSLYTQDAWKLSPRLTLEMGLRWELNPAPHDANGLKPVMVAGVDNLSTATLAPANTPIYKTSYTGFAPRVGAAYQLIQNSGKETVLRGGFGVYYDLGSGGATAGFTGFPFQSSSFTAGVPFPVPAALAVPPPFPLVSLPLDPNNSLFASNPALKLPRTFQWNLSLERSLGQHQTVTLSYVASAGRELLMTQLLNQPVGDPYLGPRPNANFGSIYYTTNDPSSDYESLQAKYQYRLSRGLQALVNYTYSHAIDAVSTENGSGILDRADADFDVRHNFSFALSYDIPKFNSGRVLRQILGDWSVDATANAYSGQPLDLVAGFFNRPDGTQVGARPDFIPGVPFWLTDPTVPGGHRLNPAAFALPPLNPNDPTLSTFARQGTLGRNEIRQPGIYQINLGLRKQFRLSERLELQFKAETFNLFNHPIFGGYGTYVQSPATLGIPTTTLNSSLGGLNSLYQMGGPRSMQLSLRISF